LSVWARRFRWSSSEGSGGRPFDAKNPDDIRTVARIRGLALIGLLVQGAHHQPHHLAMARGDTMPGHGH
jgi:hypothetical protein